MLQDEIWGHYVLMRYAWAGDADARYRGSTAGVLSALGGFLIRSGQAAFVLHVGPDPDKPMRSRWYLSEDPDDVLARAGSRYGPTAPLAGLLTAIERDEPFAIIAKPCDLSTVHRYAETAPRLDTLCVARLAMVCGGQSRLSKSRGVLDAIGVSENEIALFRYRGFGNPGRTRIELKDGRCFEKTYLEQWQDESTWDLETRCKVCADALGEAADVVVADVWPGGSPTGEDEGLGGLIVRSSIGKALVDTAVAAGTIVLGDHITPRQFDSLQPHQVRKKLALTSRLEGLDDAGLPGIEAPGLRLEALADRLDQDSKQRERDGTRRRAREGRFAEPMPERPASGTDVSTR
ncbi:MAG: Coenzyme F420 hydrogenase/dehydrogenase, beta subunit C-terminal domain [Gammaproteobacteria bacterium]|nr:Coenzyme F420 hydrogenase/dehydrogenase, beta subunit C-terminal domain [Gammaproteobacteria bacterium]